MSRTCSCSRSISPRSPMSRTPSTIRSTPKRWACSISCSNPDVTIIQALLLKFKPVNMDVLPLYIVLLVGFAPVLWLLLRAPSLGADRLGRALCADVISSTGTSRPIRAASGCSIRSPGNCCSCSAPGARSAAPSGSRRGSIRASTLGARGRLSRLRLLRRHDLVLPARSACTCRASSATTSIRSTRPISTSCASCISCRWR